MRRPIAALPLIAASLISIAWSQEPARIYDPADSDALKPLSRKLAGNIIYDQKQIWTSPFHMHARDAKWWIGFTAVTAALIATDRDSAAVLPNTPTQVRWGNRFSKIGASYTLIPLVAGFYAWGVHADDSKARETGILAAEALADGMIVYSVLKPIAGRNRPNSSGETSQFFDAGTSFPSGHSIASWSVASVIAHEYGDHKWVPFVAYGLAAVVSTSRFAGQQHYASDLVAGGAIGWFVGRYVYTAHKNPAIHRSPFLQPQIVPDIRLADHSYGIALNFPLR